MNLNFQFPGAGDMSVQFSLPSFRDGVGRLQRRVSSQICSIRESGGNVPTGIADAFDRMFDSKGNVTGVSLSAVVEEVWGRVSSAVAPGSGPAEYLKSTSARRAERNSPTESTGGLGTFNTPPALETAMIKMGHGGASDPEADLGSKLSELRSILYESLSDLSTGDVPLVDSAGSGTDAAPALLIPSSLTADSAERAALAGAAEPTDRALVDMISGRTEEQNVRIQQGRTGSFFCPEARFDVRHYVRTSPGGGAPMLTPRRIDSLRRIYESVLMPIYSYYSAAGAITGGGCGLIIVLGLATRPQVAEASGNGVSKHLEGEAVDFGIRSVSPTTIFRDVTGGAIPVPYGVISAHAGYVHVTMPYTMDGQRIEKLAVMPEGRGTLADVTHVWG